MMMKMFTVWCNLSMNLIFFSSDNNSYNNDNNNETRLRTAWTRSCFGVSNYNTRSVKYLVNSLNTRPEFCPNASSQPVYMVLLLFC